METQQQEVKSLVHDLNNKLSIVKSFFYAWSKGMEVSISEISPVFTRIDEIIFDLGKNLLGSEIRSTLRYYSFEEVAPAVLEALTKVKSIYPNISISYQEDFDKSSKLLKILFDKSIFYQVLENAIENSRKADSLNVSIHIRTNEDLVQFSIQDDGSGFRRANGYEFSPLGFGTRIIRSNCMRLGGEAIYTSTEGQGTLLKILFKPA